MKTILLLPFATVSEGDEATAKLGRQMPRQIGREIEQALAGQNVRSKFLSMRGTARNGQSGFVATTTLPSFQEILHIGEQYGAEVVLTGKIGLGERNVLFEARVTNVQEKRETFAKLFETYPTYFFDTAEETKLRITQTLGLSLSEEERVALFRRITDSWEAYLYYLMGEDDRYGFETGIIPTHPIGAISYYEKALEIDPQFTSASDSLQHYFLLLLENGTFNSYALKEELERVKQHLPESFYEELTAIL